MSTDAGDTAVTCPECGAVNPASYLFCAGCARLLSSGGVGALEHARSQGAVASDAPAGERSGAERGSAITAKIDSGKADTIAAVEERPTYETDAADRVRLRFTLFASALLLALLGLVLASVVGVKWAAAPAVLAVISLTVGLGRMSGRSLVLLRQDVKAMLRGTSADMASSSASAIPMQAGLGMYAERTAAAKVCGACGEANPANYRFCAECGSRLSI